MGSIDQKFVRLAIENSKKSFAEGNFPAGAVVALNGKILSQAVSSPYPGLLHADSKAVAQAFGEYGPLGKAVLYIGLQPCLMCTGVAYWAGIRRIVYAVSKAKVSGDYYETPKDTSEISNSFNEKIEFVYLPDLEEEALYVIRAWEQNITLK